MAQPQKGSGLSEEKRAEHEVFVVGGPDDEQWEGETDEEYVRRVFGIEDDGVGASDEDGQRGAPRDKVPPAAPVAVAAGAAAPAKSERERAARPLSAVDGLLGVALPVGAAVIGDLPTDCLTPYPLDRNATDVADGVRDACYAPAVRLSARIYQSDVREASRIERDPVGHQPPLGGRRDGLLAACDVFLETPMFENEPARVIWTNEVRHIAVDRRGYGQVMALPASDIGRAIVLYKSCPAENYRQGVMRHALEARRDRPFRLPLSVVFDAEGAVRPPLARSVARKDEKLGEAARHLEFESWQVFTPFYLEAFPTSDRLSLLRFRLSSQTAYVADATEMLVVLSEDRLWRSMMYGAGNGSDDVQKTRHSCLLATGTYLSAWVDTLAAITKSGGDDFYDFTDTVFDDNDLGRAAQLVAFFKTESNISQMRLPEKTTVINPAIRMQPSNVARPLSALDESAEQQTSDS